MPFDSKKGRAPGRRVAGCLTAEVTAAIPGASIALPVVMCRLRFPHENQLAPLGAAGGAFLSLGRARAEQCLIAEGDTRHVQALRCLCRWFASGSIEYP